MTDYTPDSLRAMAQWLDGWSYGCGQEDYYPFALQHGGPVDKLRSCADGWEADRKDNAALRERLLALTPGGSEFVGDPMRCLEFVEDRMATFMKVAAANAALREALQQIVNWSEAYPLDVFPEPDFKRAAELLKAGGMTLDAISASNMRHVVTGVGEIARKALASLPPDITP